MPASTRPPSSQRSGTCRRSLRETAARLTEPDRREECESKDAGECPVVQPGGLTVCLVRSTVGPLGRHGERPRTEGDGMKRFLVVAACTAAFVGVGAGGAFAGEVTGPPGSASAPPSKATGAPEHSNSICSFNGLNDFNQGPQIERTQTPHNQGEPGDAGHGTCAGGSNGSRGIPR
jgi:hypothetical protein